VAMRLLRHVHDFNLLANRSFPARRSRRQMQNLHYRGHRGPQGNSDRSFCSSRSNFVKSRLGFYEAHSSLVEQR
jgi:hypothetical protein